MNLEKRSPEALATQHDFANHREKVAEQRLGLARTLGVSGVTELEEEYGRAMRYTDHAFYALHGRWPVRA